MPGLKKAKDKTSWKNKIYHLINIETSVADSQDLPSKLKYLTFFLYIIVFCGLAAVLFWNDYVESRTKSFITISKTGGVCKDDPNSKTCCEVPQTVSGEFMIDTSGNWSTQQEFNVVKQIYEVSLSGLQYTNEEWSKIMKSIQTRLKEVGLTKGSKRDYSWNLIAWNSFTSLVKNNGLLQFYAAGDVAVSFNSKIVLFGYGSKFSDNDTCPLGNSYSFDPTSRKLQVTVEFTDCLEYPKAKAFACYNPCPGILAPQAMGYQALITKFKKHTWSVDMASVSTAIAVNMGILPLENLVMIEIDNYRDNLLWNMADQYPDIDSEFLENTYTYFEPLYSPMDPIYCTTYPDINGASCFIRIGSTLAFPVINSYGWSEDGLDYPTRCTLEDVNQNIAAYFYCNLNDIVVGFIYYPAEDYDFSNILLTFYYASYYSSGAVHSEIIEGEEPSEFSPQKHGYPRHRNNTTRSRGSFNRPFKKERTKSAASKLLQDPNLSDEHRELLVNVNHFGFPVDDGRILTFGKVMAEKVKTLPDGDIFAQVNAYKAMISTAWGYSNQTFTKDFDKLCSPRVHPSVSEGCAMFAFEFYNGDNRIVSIYDYQPGDQMAFTNTLYRDTAIKAAVADAPTKLIQSYYSCVLSVFQAIIKSSGLAASNTQLYSAVIFMIYMYFMVWVLNRLYNHSIPWKAEKIERGDRDIELIEKIAVCLMRDVKQGNELDANNAELCLNHLGGDVNELIQRYENEQGIAANVPIGKTV